MPADLIGGGIPNLTAGASRTTMMFPILPSDTSHGLHIDGGIYLGLYLTGPLVSEPPHGTDADVLIWPALAEEHVAKFGRCLSSMEVCNGQLHAAHAGLSSG